MSFFNFESIQTDQSILCVGFCCELLRLLWLVLIVHCNAVVESSGQCEPHLIWHHQHPCHGVDLEEGVHCGCRGDVHAQNLSQCLKQKNLMSFSPIKTSMAAYQFEFVSAKEDWSPGPVQCQLRAIEKQSGLRISLEATAVLVHQVAGISHAGVQCRPRRTKYPVWRIEPWLFQRLNYASDMYMKSFGFTVYKETLTRTLYHVGISFLVIRLPRPPPINGNMVAPIS